MPYDWKRHASDYVSFDTVGQEAEGVITDITEKDFGDGKGAKPVLHLRSADGEVRQVTCSQVNLLRLIADLGPDIGDHIKITYKGEDLARKKGGQNPPKVFDVALTPKAMMAGNGATPAPGGQPAGATAAEPYGTEPF